MTNNPQSGAARVPTTSMINGQSPLSFKPFTPNCIGFYSRLLKTFSNLPAHPSHRLFVCLSVWYPSVHEHAITGHSKQNTQIYTHCIEQCGAHNATTWQLNITRTIKGNLIQNFFFLSLVQIKSGVFLFGLDQQECDSAYCSENSINPLASHLSTMLGSAFLDSRSSTQRAILSSFAEAAILAMSTVQWSVDKSILAQKDVTTILT